MMTIKQWLTLWLIFIGYLFLGAFIFYSIERRYEEYRRVDENPEKLDVEDLLNTYYTWTNNKAHQLLLLRLKQYCNITIPNRGVVHTNDDVVEVEEEFQWTFYNSFFFALTTLSTIGYGNLHPTSCLGRMLVIVYSLVGIPLNGIVLTQLGEFFASTFLRVHQRYKGKRFETRFVLLVDIATYLVPGILLFIFLPSGVFVYFEGWTFEQSIYFAYVTLTTIGYGDFVAGQSTKDSWYNIYKVVLIFWIMFGLGYLVMILGFISRAMRCKKMARLERKLAQNLKQTHSKILNEFTRDVTYVRRMLNELYLLKFKPVYQEEKPSSDDPLIRRRSQSAPNLTKWPVLERIPKPVLYSSSEDEEETRMQFEKLRMKRRKALSENLFKHSALRVRSETDLTKIDRNATFNNAVNIERNELMARVADAYETTYSGIQSFRGSESTDNEDEPPRRRISRFEKELKGFDCFSNEEILSSEYNENDRQYVPKEEPPTYSEQWTWPNSGNTVSQISDFKRKQRLHSISQESTEKRRSLQLPGVQSLRRMSVAALNFLSPSRHFSKTSVSKEEEARDVEKAKAKESRSRKSGKVACPRKANKKRYSLCDVEFEDMREYINQVTHTRMNESNLLAALRNQIGNLERANSANPVLEQTSISDFLLIVNSLSANATLQDRDKRAEGPSPLFTLFQNEAVANVEPDSSMEAVRRRFSLAPPKAHPHNVARNKSFSSHMRRLSPMAVKGRTQSIPALSIPQIRRLRSESVSSSRPEGQSYAGMAAGVNAPSRKIRRFSVKPVTASLTMPEIVISGPAASERSSQRRIVRKRATEGQRM